MLNLYSADLGKSMTALHKVLSVTKDGPIEKRFPLSGRVLNILFMQKAPCSIFCFCNYADLGETIVGQL